MLTVPVPSPTEAPVQTQTAAAATASTASLQPTLMANASSAAASASSASAPTASPQQTFASSAASALSQHPQHPFQHPQPPSQHPQPQPMSQSPIPWSSTQHRGRSSVSDQERRPRRNTSRPQKPADIVIGKKVVEGIVSWRGADLTTDLYIGKVLVNVSTEEARTAISEMGVTVLELEVVGRRDHYQSFSLRIKKSDLPAIQNPDAWPEGILVRRFFRGKSNNNGGDSSSRNNRGSNNSGSSNTLQVTVQPLSN